MAVYTKLTKAEISDFLSKNYGINDFKNYQEIIDGIDNSNFIISTESKKFILTIFEDRINKDDLPFFMNLKLHLSKYYISCPEPIKNNKNSLISQIKNKPASIVSFLSGKTLRPNENGLYPSITGKHCKQVGEILFKLHNAVYDFNQFRANDLGILDWRNLFNKISSQIESYKSGLKSEIESYINFLEKNWFSNKIAKTPNSFGAVHVDLFPDNVFFDKNDNLSGIIDFYFACNDFFIYDLAVAINAWCFDEKNQFDDKKFQAILIGYESNKKLSLSELDFLNIALIGASLRFLLTRLNDLFFTPKNSLVKIKNPDEFLQKIRYFNRNFVLNNKIY